MTTRRIWPTQQRSVTSLHLDTKNPRLGRETTAKAPRDIIQYLFDHDKALDIARSIATRGFFPNEPLLAVKEDSHLVIVEGNRRLAALKALREAGLLDGQYQRKVERLSRQIPDIASIANVPVIIAPSRRATDQLLAGRHIGTSVLAWQAENRASFILDKLDEGYTTAQLQDQLGFTLANIQEARQTRAIAEMARSLDLPEEVKAKVESPRAKLFSTLERVFDSSVGREYLHVEPDSEHGLRGKTTKAEFLRGFTKLVSDIALGKQSSRTLNRNENIETYFSSWKPAEKVRKKQGTFLPEDIIKGRSSSRPKQQPKLAKKSKKVSQTVLPKDFKVRFGNERLRDIQKELVKLKREEYPNAGAVLLRVFFELAILDYLERSNQLASLVTTIETKEKRKLPFGVPTMKQLVPTVKKIAKDKLKPGEALLVEKTIRYDASAPFSISELHGFIHHSDLPSARDIQQFWSRTEPLFRLMLERDVEDSAS